MLWAVTSYFNPAGFRRRLHNYRLFRQHLAVPLVAVELSFDGHFELQSGEADVLVQLQGGDVMWQKERLLNIAVQSVPEDCDTIAWLDCDIIFDGDDWPERAREALRRSSLIHLYHERHDLPQDATGEQLRGSGMPCTSQSLVSKMAAGTAEPADFCSTGAFLARRSTIGLAWATRKDIAHKHGFYDACILGTGDRAILCAALGRFDWVATALHFNARQHGHYLKWAQPYFEDVNGRVGFIGGRLFHLWHGDLRQRRYAERHAVLKTFDPYLDIAVDDSGGWRWSSDKPVLHRQVREYFQSRDEDGSAGLGDGPRQA